MAFYDRHKLSISKFVKIHYYVILPIFKKNLLLLIQYMTLKTRHGICEYHEYNKGSPILQGCLYVPPLPSLQIDLILT